MSWILKVEIDETHLVEIKKFLSEFFKEELITILNDSQQINNIQPLQEEFLTTSQVCVLLKISKPTLFKKMKNGLPHRRLGRRLLFPKSEVIKSLNNKNEI